MSDSFVCCFFFFFQAEDGIRDLTVTGVQTCALPICSQSGSPSSRWPDVATPPMPADRGPELCGGPLAPWRWGWCLEARESLTASPARSGEGRGGEEGRSRWAPDHLKKKKEKRLS